MIFDKGSLIKCLIKRLKAIPLLNENDDVVNAEIISCAAAEPKGQNYCSVAQRIRVKFHFKSGSMVVRPFFVKTNYNNELERRIPNEYAMFETEIWTYKVLFEKMQERMNEIGDSRPTLWAQYIDELKNESILLEDLAENGYGILQQKSGLDLNQSLMVLSELGRFHALSMSLLDRKIVCPKDFLIYGVINGSFANNVWVTSIRALGVAMEQSWGPKWRQDGKRVQTASQRVVDTLNDLFNLENSDPKFHTVNHGDCWFVNVLFKQNQNGVPIGLKFVDLSLVHYNSLSTDLTYFMYSSIEPKIRREYYDELLEKYRSSLIENMKIFELDESSAPSFEELREEMQRMQFFGLVTLTSLYVVLTSSVPINREGMSDGETEERKTWSPEHHSSKEFQRDVEDDLKLFLKLNVV